MTTLVGQPLYQTHINSIVSELFQIMLETEVTPVIASGRSRSKIVMAIVGFTGAWRGALSLECPENHARCLAKRLLGIAEPPELDDEIGDALGEITNIIAGNLKPLLGPGSGVQIGIPSVVQASDYSLDLCGSNALSHCAFSSDMGEFRVTLVEGDIS